MKKKLSLVTPLYNTERKYLNDLIKCIKPYQKDVEWILVNDSPDNIALKEMIAAFDSSYIKVFTHEKNLGIFSAYTTGFLNATAEYCCILDHDDVYDAKNVLRAINEKPDLIYTNEYKFNKKGKSNKFIKPDFDFLSTCFYFYTHHVTVMKTETVKDILREKSNSGNYTSLFDIHITLEYISRYIGKDFNVIHLNNADYGWRIHKNSTAGNLEQKLSGYFERLRKTEEFFRVIGEYPMLNIHRNIGYIVEADFMSVYDLVRYPLKFEDFVDYFKKFKKINTKNKSIRFEHNDYSITEWKYFYRMLFKIPAQYLIKQNCIHFFVPDFDKRKLVSPKNFKLYPPGVPFMVKIAISEINSQHIGGMWINLDNSEKKDFVYAIIRK
ncbi:glycosyltransferase [Clostridium boliviensis]|uniref:Glycosyltransferase n=1 Tax=Clostridium boliviensis TaxID=318465 RepID=A0ABU4GPW1_9CLOT|nr:glycosyltransferase [Clostridium boliviensis]MDW2799676.1 glycosyltransferase [Clostridium boliviensis]